jgi:hypothetical protein
MPANWLFLFLSILKLLELLPLIPDIVGYKRVRFLLIRAEPTCWTYNIKFGNAADRTAILEIPGVLRHQFQPSGV